MNRRSPAGLGALAVLALAGCLPFAGPPTEAEKRLLPAVEALADYGVTNVNPARCARYRSTRYADFSREVDYEYDSDRDPDADETLYLNATLSLEPTPRSARETFLVQKTALLGGLRLMTARKLEELKGLALDADQAYAARIVDEAQGGVGNAAVVRRNTRVLYLVLIGVEFEDADAFAEFLKPYVERLGEPLRAGTATPAAKKEPAGPPPAADP